MSTIKLWEIKDYDLWGTGTKHLEFVNINVPRENVIEYAKLKYAVPQDLIMVSEAEPNKHSRAIGVDIFEMDYYETSFTTIQSELPKLKAIVEHLAEIKKIRES
jgi:hypothetical protein